MTDWQRHREPLATTLTRTVGIALVAGAIVALSSGRLRSWPTLSLLMLWPSFGGHWVELMFLNWLRPRLSANAFVQRGARVALWFVAGIVLAAGARWTASLLLVHPRVAWLTWAVAGMGFIVIELVAHAGLQLRGRPSFYDGLG
jgi:hypothetical protein